MLICQTVFGILIRIEALRFLMLCCNYNRKMNMLRRYDQQTTNRHFRAGFDHAFERMLESRRELPLFCHLHNGDFVVHCVFARSNFAVKSRKKEVTGLIVNVEAIFG
jgi:hypothetical protein